MYILFLTCVLGAIVAVPIHFLSVEHLKFQEKYGKERGAKISEVYSRLSANLLFFSLIRNLDFSSTQIYYSALPKHIGLDSGCQFLHSIDSPDSIYTFRFAGYMALNQFGKRVIAESVRNA